MNLKLKFLFLSICWLTLFQFNTSGQKFSFRNWRTDNGLPDSYIYNIVQDNKGFLWVSTGKGLVKFDGFEFHRVVFPDSITERYVSASLRDSNGNLWLGCSDGAIFFTDGTEIEKIEIPGIQNINQILEYKDDHIYVFPQDRKILKINRNRIRDISEINVARNIVMASACFTAEGKLLVGTMENLLYCSINSDSLKVIQQVEGIEFTKVQALMPVTSEPGSYLVGTEGAGLFVLRASGDEAKLVRLTGDPELETLDIKGLSETSDGNILIPTYGSGVIFARLSPDQGRLDIINKYSSLNGLQGDNARTVFRDMEDNIWIGLYGEGLSMLRSFAFSFHMPSDDPDQNNIIYITGHSGNLLLGTPGGYYLYDPSEGRTLSFTDLSRFTGKTEITSYLYDDGKLWIGTRGNGFYVREGDKPAVLFHRSGSGGEDHIRHINADKRHIWLSTLLGVIVIDKTTGRVVRKFATDDRLPHNSINQVFLLKNGDALVATECDRLYTISLTDGVTTGEKVMSGFTKNKILCFTETNDGQIFAGTAGNGVFWFRGDSVVNLTTAEGLFSNYCYSLHTSGDGRIWIGHERGFSRYNIKSGILRSFSTDFANEGDCNPDSHFEIEDGKTMIGTTEGLIIYDLGKDKIKRIAPLTSIISVTINNVKYPLKPSYSLPYSKYIVRFDYVGINFVNPEKVFYTTRLDNFDDEWSQMKPDRHITYPLRDGRYRFNVISVNEDGMTQDESEYIDIFIKKPVWRTWWFIMLMILFSAAVIIIIVREREKAQKKIKEYLESELAARTRLVMQQKDEIELQNIEITDSINYAKRIQTSLLPDLNRLKETFSDAFLFFHPRDIVSGDFYWFDKADDDKFIIVCADSTGHGVPGAFMSMIGSALLQDIISRKKITTPSQILSLLDKQIFSTLNQNVDVGVSNDGMDMVVCEINISTRHIRFASAMRPVIIVMGGESYYIKGNRCSVGGESVVEKYFDDQEYYLSEGDSIYMFSDGLPDQFGGKDGKKLKIARLKRLIEEVCTKPMSEQKELISDFYFDWKGDYEQVDDILMMGIRI